MSVAEHKSDTVALYVNGEMLTEFIVDRLAVEITRRGVLIRADCRDTYEDKVLLNSAALEVLGYAPNGSDIPRVTRRRRFLAWLAS